MKRISILLVLLMAFVAACASDTATPLATDEPDPTVEATPDTEPSDEASTEPGTLYMYFADGAAFTVTSQNEGLAEQLLGELP